MSPRITFATVARIFKQLSHDHRTVALLLLMPSILLTLLKFVYNDNDRIFNAVAGPMLGIFPFVTMFLVTSIATLRERTQGTLERLMAMPTHKFDLIAGYALAFGIIAIFQVGIALFVAINLLGLDIVGPVEWLFAVAAVDALLGVSTGLFVSAFARTEFQAVQFLPAVVLPQFLLCGLLVARDNMHQVLSAISDFLPLSYAIDSVKHISSSSDIDQTFLSNLGIVLAVSLVMLLLGAATLRRRTD